MCSAGLNDSGPTGSLQEAAEGESSNESSLAQGGQPTMPRPGARSLSDGQLDGLMGQLASMNNDKMRKDLLGESHVASSGRSLSPQKAKRALNQTFWGP